MTCLRITIALLLLLVLPVGVAYGQSGGKAQRFRGIQLVAPTPLNNSSAKNRGVALLAPSGMTSSYSLVFPQSQGSIGQVLTISNGEFLGWATPLTDSTGWVMTGSLYGDSTTSFIGTRANTPDLPLIMRTDGIERMRILGGSGLVGIGTATPAAQLQINPATAATTALLIRMPSSPTAPAFAIRDNANNNLLTIGTSGALSLHPFGASAGNTNELRFLELAANGVNYVGFKAPDAIASDRIWTLPAADGTNGQALTTNGSGVLQWATVLTAADAWSVSGNTITSSGGALGAPATGSRIGTNDAVDLRFTTNNLVRMIIASTGAISMGGTLGVTGLTTLSAGATITGTTQINATGTAATTIGNTGSTITLGSLATTLKTSPGLNDRVVIANSSGLLDQASISSVVQAGLSGAAWLLTGNGSTSPATNFIGTTNAQPLVIRTNNLTRMVLSAAGDVVLGSGDGTTSVTSGILRPPDRTGTDAVGANLSLRAGNGTGTGGSGAIIFSTSSPGASGSAANAVSERMRITRTGDVVIGGGEGTATVTSATLRGPDAIGTDRPGSDVTIRAGLGTGIGTSGNIVFATAPAGTNGSTANVPVTRMTINNVGQVGIGQVAGQQQLEVAGNILIDTISAGVAGSLVFRSNSNLSRIQFRAGAQTADITYTLPLAQPTAGSVLSSDASGTWSWISPTANYWTLTGNASTTASNYLGTSDAQPLSIRQNGQQRILLNSGGGVEVTGGTGTNGGTINIIAGGSNGIYSGTTGTVLISGGSSAYRPGGNVTVSGGSSTNSAGGNVTITGGSSQMGAPGLLTLQGGSSTGGGVTSGGNVIIQSGTGGAGTNTEVRIQTAGVTRLTVRSDGGVSIAGNLTVGSTSTTTIQGSVTASGAATFNSTLSVPSGLATLSGGATITGTTQINATGSSPTTIGTSTSSVTIPRLGGTVKTSVGSNDRIVITGSDGTLDQASLSAVLSSAARDTSWVLTGNNLIDPATQYLGTSNAQPLIIRTNNTNRLWITSTGLIQIGSSSGTSTLTVNGTFNATGNSTIGGTLAVTGATTLSSTLAVTGATTINNTLSVTGTTNINTTGTAATTIGNTTAATAVTINAGSTGRLRLQGLPVQTSTTDDILLINASNQISRIARGNFFTAWGLQGNALTNPSTQYLGTTDNTALSMRTNGTERLRIAAAGDVVFGSGDGTATVTSSLIRPPDVVGTNLAGANLSFRAGNGTGTGGSGAIVFSTAAAGTSGSAANTFAERMRITRSGDVVLGAGEGTATPTAGLIRPPDGAGTDIVGVPMIIRAGNGTGTGGGGPIIMSTSAASGTSSSTANLVAERMRITPAGNVGINTNATNLPTQRLHVAGNILVDTSAASTAGQLQFMNPARTFQTNIRAGAQAANLTYTLPLSAPQAGQVLSSDASGNLSWVINGASSWLLTGNSSTNPSSNYIGTSDAKSLSIRQNGQERILLDSLGAVIITTASGTTGQPFSMTAGTGTTSPGGNIVITGGNSNAGAVPAGGVTITGGRSTGNRGGNVRISGGTSYWEAGSVTIRGGDAIRDNTGGNVTIAAGTGAAGTTASIFFNTWQNITRMTIAANGNVSLTNNLSVAGAASFSSALGVSGATTLSSTLGVSGLSTLSGGATITGATNINSSGTATTTIGNANGAVTIGRVGGVLKTTVGTNDRLVIAASDGTLDQASFGSVFAAAVRDSAWMLGGNANTNPATQFLGTTDAQPLVFRTQNTERMRITNTGLVQIGAASGASTLTVNGTFGVTGNSTVGGTLGVTGAVTAGSLTVNGATTLSNTLSVTGAVSINTTGTASTTIGNTTAGTSVTIRGGDGGATGGVFLTGLPQQMNPSDEVLVLSGSRVARVAQATLFTAWATQGNPGTNPATQYLGTRDNNAFVLRTNDVERLRISAAGDLVLGRGDGTATVVPTTLRAPDAAGTNVAGANLALRAGNGTGSAGSGAIVFSTAAPGAAGAGVNTMAERMRIARNGDVVLGSGDGTATLTSTTLRAPNGTGTDVTGANLSLRAGNGTGSGGSGAIVFSTAPSAASSATANTISERMRITSAGNVGINLTAPFERLQVAGNVLVDNSTPGTAGQLQFLNPARTFRTNIRAGAQGANITYTLPTVAPTNGFVLTSDASGNLSWTYAGSGAWQLAGNTITAGNYLGTSDGSALSIRQNAQERILLTSLGAIDLRGGTDAVNGSGGAVVISAGGGAQGNTGGSVGLTAGSGYQGSGGSITIRGGSSTNGNGGNITLQGGSPGQAGNPGNIVIQGGGAGSTVTIGGGSGSPGSTATVILQTGGVNRLTLTSDGTVSIPGSLSVTGTTTLQNLNVTGSTSLTGTLSVTGLTTLSGGLTTTGTVNINATGSGTTTIGNSSSTVTIGSLATTLKTTVGTNDRVVIASSDGTLDQASFSTVFGAFARDSAWVLNGNAGINPTTQFLGTTDAQPLVVRTSNTERMRILSTGNVGIGTASPATRLHVVDAAAANAGGQPIVTLTGAMASTTVGSGPELLFRDTSGIDAAAVRAYMFGSSLSGLAFSTGWNNLQDRMVINNAGLVGIGETVPSQLLHVRGNIFIDNSDNIARELRFREPSSSGTNITTFKAGAQGADINYTLPTTAPTVGQILSSDANGVMSWTGLWNINGNDVIEGTHYIGTSTNKRLEFRTNATERMRLTAAGDLGIGNNNPAYKLDVTGDINASANVRAAGAILTTSDIRLKRNIQPIGNAMDVVAQLQPVTYQKKTSIADSVYGMTQMGFIAQDLQKVIPIAVSVGSDPDATLSVDYQSLIPMLTKAVQEQQAVIDQRAERLRAQEALIRMIEERIKALEEKR